MKKFLSILLISFLLIPNLLFAEAVFPRLFLPGTAVVPGQDWGSLILGKDIITGLYRSLRLSGNGDIYIAGITPNVLPANPNDGTGLFGMANMWFDYVAGTWRYGACDSNAYPIVYLGTNILHDDGDNIGSYSYVRNYELSTWQKAAGDNLFPYPVGIDIVHHKALIIAMKNLQSATEIWLSDQE